MVVGSGDGGDGSVEVTKIGIWKKRTSNNNCYLYYYC